MLAQTKVEKCPCCQSINIVKNGFTRHNNQRVLCKDCGKSPVLQRKKAISYNPSQLRRAFLERLSLSGVSRVFFISYYRVFRV
jgi:transposase-like protein